MLIHKINILINSMTSILTYKGFFKIQSDKKSLQEIEMYTCKFNKSILISTYKF